MPHIIIEANQGDVIDDLKEEALRQILDNRYYSGFSGEVLCIGLAHDKKDASWRTGWWSRSSFGMAFLFNALL